ncbi:MAG: sodium/proline symporter [Bdellovibrionales bacterium]
MLVVLSFSVFLAIFIIVGLASVKLSKGTNKDYLVAGRGIKPWMVALSAVSTNNSGYMFIGQIGFTYMQGLSSIWLMIGWITGDFLMSLFVHKRLREVSEQRDILSFGGLLSRWWGTDYRKFRLLVGIITVVFLGAYAAAQFKAGGKALNVLFGWDTSTGVIIGAIMVVAYCLAGGIRASIWTDAAQSIVMIFAMTTLLVFAVNEAGGISEYFAKASGVSDTYMTWFPDNLLLGSISGPFLFVLGWLFAGFGIVGQPHIMIRLMTMDSAKNMNRFRTYYYTWYTLFYLFAIGVGFSARILLPETANFDPELSLPTLSQNLLPEFLVGVMLAGIFAATMSTADSQILSCSAAFTRDILPRETDKYWVTKAATILIAVGAMLIALFGSQNVFNLVLIAWSVLSAAFAPILVLFSLGKKIMSKLLY